MRVTPHRQQVIGTFHARQNFAKLAQLQNDISSGIRVHKPSDDPRGQKTILDQQVLIQKLGTQSQAIDDGRAILNNAHQQLRSVQQLTVQARGLALQAGQVNDASESQALATEIDAILKTLNTYVNTQYEGRYLFSGQNLQTRPYADVSKDSTYQGSVAAASLSIPGIGPVNTYYSGHDIFSTGNQGTTSITGTTGAIGGTGIATLAGSGKLLVQHTLTTYASGSGVSAGSSSTTADTIIGATGVHQLQIDEGSGTISLNGGVPVAFSSADTDLIVTGPRGEKVSLDTTTITPGFVGTVDITADGTLSTDGGITQTPIDFSENQQLIDDQGRLRYVDSRNITRSGEDSIQLDGATDLFAELRSLRDDLNNYDQVDNATRNKRIENHLAALDVSNDHLLKVIGQQSVSLQSYDRLQNRIEDLQFEAVELLNNVQGTDIVDAASQLQEATNQNQFTLATLASIFQTSLLDFLR